MPSPPHRGLDFIGLDRRAVRQQFAAGGRDPRVVFNPDADVPELPGHALGWAYVEVGLYCQHHAGAVAAAAFRARRFVGVFGVGRGVQPGESVRELKKTLD